MAWEVQEQAAHMQSKTELLCSLFPVKLHAWSGEICAHYQLLGSYFCKLKRYLLCWAMQPLQLMCTSLIQFM